MPVLRFHLLNLYYSQVEGGFIVTVTTNAACHLYLRYSDNFPHIHRKGIPRRGLVMGWDARYCFTAYHHIEQNEESDTFTHTFTWPGWKDCNTRYFYFWGTMGGQDMVSDTPIFWLHYLWGAPPEYIPACWNDGDGGWIWPIVPAYEKGFGIEPCRTFRCDKMTFPITRMDGVANFPDCTFNIYQLDPAQMIIMPALTTAEFHLTVPYWPNFEEFTISFPQIELDSTLRYAWTIHNHLVNPFCWVCLKNSPDRGNCDMNRQFSREETEPGVFLPWWAGTCVEWAHHHLPEIPP